MKAREVSLREREVLPGRLADLPTFFTEDCFAWDILGGAGEVLTWVVAAPVICRQRVYTTIAMPDGKARVFSNLFENERTLKGYLATFLWGKGYYWKEWLEEEF